MKSEQLLAVLHLSLLCLGLRSFETQTAQTFFIFKSLWVILWIVAWQRDVASCSLSTATRLFSMMSERHSTADNVRAVVGWPGLIPCLTVLCSLLQLSTHQNTLLWHTASWWHPILPKQPSGTPLSKTLPSIVHDSTPLTDIIIPRKWNLHHPLVPYIGWLVNGPCLITCTFLEWLGISLCTLH